MFLRLPAHENDIDDKVYSNPQKRLSNCPRKDKKRTGARCRKSATAPLFSMGYSSSVKINSLSENSLSVMAYDDWIFRQLADIDSRNNIPDTSPQLDFDETDYEDYLKEKWNRGL